MKKLSVSANLLSIGNTSARVKYPFEEYQNLLQSLERYTSLHPEMPWNGKTQKEFASFQNKLQGIRKIATEKKTPPDKDVRNKITFLKDLGFITVEQKNEEVAKKYLNLTDVGNRFLALQENNEYQTSWELSGVSFLYLLQFLKWEERDFDIKPIFSLIYSCLEFDNELPYEFVKYYWPRAKSKKDLLDFITQFKSGKESKDFIRGLIMNSSDAHDLDDNLKELKEDEITKSHKFKENFMKGFFMAHGKSPKYLEPTHDFFLDLLDYWANKKNWSKSEKKEFILAKVKSKESALKSSLETSVFNNFLFNDEDISSAKNLDYITFFENTDLMKVPSKKALLKEFYIFYRLMTDLTNSKEYGDINFRHLRLLDIFHLDYKTVKLRVHFKYFFEEVKDKLLEPENNKNENYIKKLVRVHNEFSEIHSFFDEDIDQLLPRLYAAEPEVKAFGLKNYESKMKQQKLDDLISTVWTKENILDFLKSDLSEDSKIRKKVKDLTGNDLPAKGPAFFEYLIAIVFYHLSNQQADLKKITRYLDSNALPTTHMIGGEPDIEFEFQDNSYLVEVTLSDKDGQRQMEAEPVPRHVANFIKDTNNPDAICFFIAKNLDPNNLVVLRNYKFSKWYFPRSAETIDYMNIFPLEINDLVYCLESDLDMEDILDKVNDLIESSETDGWLWYENEIKKLFE